MGKLTISMAIFNSYVANYQRVFSVGYADKMWQLWIFGVETGQ